VVGAVTLATNVPPEATTTGDGTVTKVIVAVEFVHVTVTLSDGVKPVPLTVVTVPAMPEEGDSVMPAAVDVTVYVAVFDATVTPADDATA